MIEGLFDSTTIPVLEEVVQFAQARHEVLAGNIANLDTPGYRSRDMDVAKFQESLRDAVAQRRQRPTTIPFQTPSTQSFGLTSHGSIETERFRGLAPPAAIGPSPRTARSDAGSQIADIAEDAKSILYHDDSNVGVEHQVSEIAKNHMQHNMALTILSSQFRLLQVAITEKV